MQTYNYIINYTKVKAQSAVAVEYANSISTGG